MPDCSKRVMPATLARQRLASIGLAFAALAVNPPQALAQSGFQVIEVPGAVYTDAHGINNAGDVVGEYLDADWNQHGFLLSGGVYTTIDVPGSITTIASLDLDGLITDEARSDWIEDTPLKTAWGVPANQAAGCSGSLIDSTTTSVICHQLTPNGVYPAWLDPAIAWDFSMTFQFTGTPLVNYSISGCRKYFPAYEVWAGGQPIYLGLNSTNPVDIMYPCNLAVDVEQTGTVTLR